MLDHLARQKNARLFSSGFGDAAAETMRAASLGAPDADADPRVILRPHPAEADAFLAQENPFSLCNRRLRAMGAAPVDW